MIQRHYVFLCMFITLFAEQNLNRSQRFFVTIFLKFHIRSSRHWCRDQDNESIKVANTERGASTFHREIFAENQANEGE